MQGEGNTGHAVIGKACLEAGGVKDPEHAWKIPNAALLSGKGREVPSTSGVMAR